MTRLIVQNNMPEEMGARSLVMTALDAAGII
jgi:hypothetical protein